MTHDADTPQHPHAQAGPRGETHGETDGQVHGETGGQAHNQGHGQAHGQIQGHVHGHSGARRADGVLSGQVVDVLRAAGRALTPAEVQQELAAVDSRPLAYTTVVTVLSRLHAQGLADRFRTGRAFAYVLVADHSRLAARQMRRVLDAEPDRDEVLASFVGDLSDRDEEVLRRLLGIDAPGRDV